MKRIAVFPGSFDPITRGHESVVKRAVPLFDLIYIAIGVNSEKHSYFPLKKRLQWIEQVFEGYNTVKIDTFSGLTVDYCKKVNASFLLRGLRSSADFEFERKIGQANQKLHPGIETVFLLTTPEYTFINASIVRDIHKHGGDISHFIPDAIDLNS